MARTGKDGTDLRKRPRKSLSTSEVAGVSNINHINISVFLFLSSSPVHLQMHGRPSVSAGSVESTYRRPRLFKRMLCRCRRTLWIRPLMTTSVLNVHRHFFLVIIPQTM